MNTAIARVLRDFGYNNRITPTWSVTNYKALEGHSQERNELLRIVKSLDRILWKKWSGYYRRSLMETKIYCIKLLCNKLQREIFLVR